MIDPEANNFYVSGRIVQEPNYHPIGPDEGIVQTVIAFEAPQSRTESRISVLAMDEDVRKVLGCAKIGDIFQIAGELQVALPQSGRRASQPALIATHAVLKVRVETKKSVIDRKFKKLMKPLFKTMSVS